MIAMPTDRREELMNTIKDALFDMQVGRIYGGEFKQSVLNLITELRAVEEKEKVKEPAWKMYFAEFQKIIQGAAPKQQPQQPR